jgi:hypothetical protein
MRRKLASILLDLFVALAAGPTLIALLLTMLTYAKADTLTDIASPEIISGRYYLHQGGTPIGDYKSQLHTAIAEAVKLSDKCGCTITIKTPDIKVRTRRVERVEGTDGNVTLLWGIPTTRVNGQPLAVTEIQKYVIAYRQEGSSELLVDVLDGAATEYRLAGLVPGRWSFKMLAVDTHGLSSVWTETVQKEIR